MFSSSHLNANESTFLPVPLVRGPTRPPRLTRWFFLLGGRVSLLTAGFLHLAEAEYELHNGGKWEERNEQPRPDAMA